MGEQPQLNPADPRSAAAATGADPVTAELLVKHSAGEKLSPSEYGKIGAFAAKVKGIFGSKGGGDAQLASRPTGDPARVGAVAPGEASGDGLGAVAPDPRLVQRTTGALLKSADSIARRYVARHARAAGADDKTLARFDSAAALPAASQELIVETSPDLLASLGVDPRNYPLTVCIGALGLWGANLWLCVDELKKVKSDREPKPVAIPVKQTSPTVASLPVVLPVVTEPARPPNAPGEVFAGGPK